MVVAEPFQNLWQKAGFTDQTPIQTAVAEPLTQDENIIGLAPTGSGKTLAFGLPLLTKVVPDDGLQVLILAPAQELVIQTRDVLQPYAEAIGVRVLAITGNTNVARQKEQLKKHPEVIVATAGRLLELIGAGKVRLARLQTMVVDEADELLRQPGLDQVREIAQDAPADVQMAYFSATSSPILRELPKWFGSDARVIDVRPIDKTQGPVQHYFLQGGREHQVEWLGRLARQPHFAALVFFNKNSSLSKAAGILRHQRVSYAVLDRNDRSIARKNALALFRKGKVQLLLVTDLAGRGLDIPKLPAVINFEVPRTATTYIHRAGRTGRMGQPGMVITMGDDHDLRDLRKLAADYDIQRAYVVDGGISTEKPEVDADQLRKVARAKSLKGQNAAAANGKRSATGQGKASDEPARKPHKKNRARDKKSKGKPKKKQQN
ncbi:DEAD/DEAH box helicase [Lacticaseibacillus sharpeae]|uniref:ATP-dependent RNA helicase n=1 Tax=Lacticaseibacillus sharpeae JCM 1186 = DSM 20505 TaxID=1291052 RepID=A0A0R1ZR42_9LACO|nr:DEAD/DEAH box helicase [Lacticaseibacillus sharpeae]KRM54395.1 ATP-dependent RNA helicase [Lacticaseibacillus sharpeae JCM 1186 = DSM 20505]